MTSSNLNSNQYWEPSSESKQLHNSSSVRALSALFSPLLTPVTAVLRGALGHGTTSQTANYRPTTRTDLNWQAYDDRHKDKFWQYLAGREAGFANDLPRKRPSTVRSRSEIDSVASRINRDAHAYNGNSASHAGKKKTHKTIAKHVTKYRPKTAFAHAVVKRPYSSLAGAQATSSNGVAFVSSTMPVTSSVVGVTITAHGPDRIRVQGRQLLGQISTSNSSILGSVMATMRISGSMFAGTRISQYFDVYEYWEPHRLGFELIPGVASTTPGQYAMYLEPDPDDLPSAGSVVAWDTTVNDTRARVYSIFGNVGSTTLVRRGKFQPLYCQSRLSATAVPRLDTAGGLVIIAGPSAPADLMIGSIYVNFDITFNLPVEKPESSLAGMIGLQSATSSAVIQTLGAGEWSLNAVTLLNRFMDNSFELNNQAKFGLPGAYLPENRLALRPGVYYVHAALALADPIVPPSMQVGLINQYYGPTSMTLRAATGSGHASFPTVITPSGTTNDRVFGVSQVANFMTTGVAATMTCVALGRLGTGNVSYQPFPTAYVTTFTSLLAVGNPATAVMNAHSAGVDVAVEFFFEGDKVTAGPTPIYGATLEIYRLPDAFSNEAAGRLLLYANSSAGAAAASSKEVAVELIHFPLFQCLPYTIFCDKYSCQDVYCSCQCYAARSVSGSYHL